METNESHESRAIYETLKRKRVSDSHWWRVKKAAATAGIPLDREGLTQLIRLQKISPRFCYSALEEQTRKQEAPAVRDMFGHELRKLIMGDMGIRCHRSTFGKWFHRLNVSFNAKTLYSKTTASLVILQAIIYGRKNT